jgi:hypothetical protein
MDDNIDYDVMMYQVEHVTYDFRQLDDFTQQVASR